MKIKIKKQLLTEAEKPPKEKLPAVIGMDPETGKPVRASWEKDGNIPTSMQGGKIKSRSRGGGPLWGPDVTGVPLGEYDPNTRNTIYVRNSKGNIVDIEWDLSSSVELDADGRDAANRRYTAIDAMLRRVETRPGSARMGRQGRVLREVHRVSEELLNQARKNTWARIQALVQKHGVERTYKILGVERRNPAAPLPKMRSNIDPVAVTMGRNIERGYDTRSMSPFVGIGDIENDIKNYDLERLVRSEFEDLFGDLYTRGSYNTEIVTQDFFINEPLDYPTAADPYANMDPNRKTASGKPAIEPTRAPRFSQEKTTPIKKGQKHVPGGRHTRALKIGRKELHEALWYISSFWNIKPDRLTERRTRALQNAKAEAAEASLKRWAGMKERVFAYLPFNQAIDEEVKFLQDLVGDAKGTEATQRMLDYEQALFELDEYIKGGARTPEQDAKIEAKLRDMKQQVMSTDFGLPAPKPGQPAGTQTFGPEGVEGKKLGTQLELGLNKPKINVRGALKGGAVGAVIAGILSAPEVAYAYQSRGGRAAMDKATELLPSVIDPTGFYDVMVGMYDIFTAEDPKERSKQYGKGIGQAVGTQPEDFPGGEDVASDSYPESLFGGKWDMPSGYQPLSQKPEDIEQLKTQIDLGKTYDPHGNIPSHKLGQTTSTPLPPGQGADALKDRPMYMKNDKGRWVQDQPPKPPPTPPKPQETQRSLRFLRSPKFWEGVVTEDPKE